MRWLLYFVFVLQCVQAQSPLLDSLHSALRTQAPFSKNSAETLLEISKEWQLQSTDSSSYYAQAALDIALQRGYLNLLPKAYNQLGSSNYLQSNYIEAIKNFENGVSYAQQLGDSIYLGHLYNNIGLSYKEMGLYEEAISNIQRAMIIRRENQEWDDMHASLYNMALVYAYGFEDGGPSLKYVYKVIKYYEPKPDFKWKLAMTYNLACYVHFKFYNQLDSAEYYANKGLSLLEKDEAYASSYLYSNLGMIFLGKGDLLKSEKSFIRALKQKFALGNPLEIASGYEDIARMYMAWEKLDEADKALQRAFEMYDSLHNAEGRIEVLRLKSELLRAKGNYEEALNALTLSLSMRDSLNIEETTRRLAWLRSIHEEDRLDNENLLLTTQRDIQELRAAKEQNRRNMLLMFSFFLLILVLLVYIRFREKNKLSLALAAANEQLKQNEARLNQLNSMKDSFFAIIGHDLKNPISAYKNIIDRLKHGGESEHAQDNILEELSDSADQLLNLLQNLLQWAQREQGRFVFTPRAVLLHDEVESAIRVYRSACNEKSIDLENLVDEDLVAMADKEMLQTILRNLINNAVKFTSQGSITVFATEMESELKITVKDTGTGMSNEKVVGFMRSDLHFEIESLSEKGTGLGLSLVKSFVQEHKGKIEITSEKGKGTSISFTLPKFTTRD